MLENITQAVEPCLWEQRLGRRANAWRWLLVHPYLPRRRPDKRVQGPPRTEAIKASLQIVRSAGFRQNDRVSIILAISSLHSKLFKLVWQDLLYAICRSPYLIAAFFNCHLKYQLKWWRTVVDPYRGHGV